MLIIQVYGWPFWGSVHKPEINSRRKRVHFLTLQYLGYISNPCGQTQWGQLKLQREQKEKREQKDNFTSGDDIWDFSSNILIFKLDESFCYSKKANMKIYLPFESPENSGYECEDNDGNRGGTN